MSKGTPRDPMRYVSLILRRSDIDAILRGTPYSKEVTRVLAMLIDRWNVSPKYDGRNKHYGRGKIGDSPANL